MYLYIFLHRSLNLFHIRYLGLKFDQVNEHLHKLVTENVCGIKRAWESPMLLSQQRELLNAPSSKHMTWIVM